MFSPALQSALARSGSLDGVRDTPDLRRVRDLPQLDWKALVADLRGPVLRKVLLNGGKPCRGGHVVEGCCSVCGTPLDLRDIQVGMLAYVHEYQGGFFTARTGAGKMLTSLLVPTMLAARKPLLLVPASRVDPTYTALQAYKNHWRIVVPHVLSYERLSQAAYADTIVKLAPDVVTADEAHGLRDTSGSRWKRLKRHEGKCAFVAMSGSFANRSPNEYGHLAIRALGQLAPVPLDFIERQEWARALDRKSTVPLGPGALLRLMPEAVTAEVGFEAACVQFGRRLVTAPGVVSSGFDVPDIALTCAVTYLEPSAAIREASKHMTATWETPCGYPFELALDLWRHQQEVSTGMYGRWKVVPPTRWLVARKAVSQFLRDVISRGELDTPAQVYAAVDDGRIPDDGSVATWRVVEPEYEVELVPVWLCDSTLEWAAQWAERERGIVWTKHSTFGERLSQMTGLPYYREAGCDARGVHIEKEKGPCIASVQSCGVGNNLQQHNRNLVISCPPSGMLEQLVSRTHREGQKRHVHVEFLHRLDGDIKVIEGARADATAIDRQFQICSRISYAEWLTDVGA